MMKTVKKSEFLSVLNSLRPGLTKRESYEQHICFNFHSDHIVTYNDNISVSIPFDSGIEGGVRAEELYKLVEKLPLDELDICTINNEFRLKCGEVEAGINLVDNPHPQIKHNDGWSAIPDGLIDAIKMAMFSVSKNMTYPRLTCIHVKGNEVCSADGYRVTQVYLTDKSKFDFLLPGIAAVHLSSYEFSDFLVDDSWIHFLDSKTKLVFSSRRVDESFLEVDSLFSDVNGVFVTLPQALVSVVDRCKLMTEAEIEIDRMVEITLEPGKLSCMGSKELGWVKEGLPVDYDGDKVIIRINPNFLTVILNRTNQVEVGHDKCKFTGENFRHLVLLIGE